MRPPGVLYAVTKRKKVRCGMPAQYKVVSGSFQTLLLFAGLLLGCVWTSNSCQAQSATDDVHITPRVAPLAAENKADVPNQTAGTVVGWLDFLAKSIKK